MSIVIPGQWACDNCGVWTYPPCLGQMGWTDGPTHPGDAWCPECAGWTPHGTLVDNSEIPATAV